MNAARLLYRTRQFWQAVGNRPLPEDLKQVQAVLTQPQFDLFLRLQPSEQAHSLRVFLALLTRLEGIQPGCEQDILVAALLHDVGKSRFSLGLWERVLIVVGKKFFPAHVRRWGRAPVSSGRHLKGSLPVGGEAGPGGIRRAFVIAEQHPEWGAQMAEAAGVSPLTVALIRRHQEQLPSPDGGGNLSLEERLLRELQAVDDES